MKKSIFILASAMLLASCGNNGNGSAYSEKSGTPVADPTVALEPLSKLSEKLASTTKIGLEAKVVENIDASFHTKANADLGLKDATYPIKSSASATAKLGVDFDAVKASGSIDAKLSASAKYPSLSDSGDGKLVDKEINIPETSLSAKAYLDDNKGYFDISGAKSGIKSIANEIAKIYEGASGIGETIDALPGKIKSPEIPAEFIETIKSAPEVIGSYIGLYGPVLISFISEASSMPKVSGQPDYSQLIKLEKVDSDYRFTVDVKLADVSDLIVGLAGGSIDSALIKKILEKIDASLHASITFNENALLSVHFSAKAAVKDLNLEDLVETQGEMPIDKINLNAEFSAGIDFKYGNDVVIETLSASDKAAYEDLNLGGDIADE